MPVTQGYDVRIGECAPAGVFSILKDFHSYLKIHWRLANGEFL
jgi:hypothetical protein